MKKGFTMIEILAVFTITALILLVVTPFIINLLKNGNSKAKESFLNDLFIATEAYIQDDNLVVTENTTTVTIRELIESGYLRNNLINPDNKKELTHSDNLDKVVIVYKDDENVLQYSFEFQGDKEESLNEIYKAAKVYIDKKQIKITNSVTTITINELIESECLKSTLINFENNKQVSDIENRNKTVEIYLKKDKLQFNLKG